MRASRQVMLSPSRQFKGRAGPGCGALANLPTGSITEKDSMPHGHDGAPMQMRMEYPMQLGSGTYDLKPGLTYTGQGERWSWGAQGIATIRTGENDEGYTLGNRTDLTGWVAYGWTPAVSTSLRLAAASWGNIDGQDKQVSPTMSPAADPRAGRPAGSHGPRDG